LVFVVASFLDKFLNATTTLESLTVLKSGGGVRYDSTLPVEAEPKPKPPKPPPPEAARLLDACDLNWRLLMLVEYFVRHW
jgi:hypothetical protein